MRDDLTDSMGEMILERLETSFTFSAGTIRYLKLRRYMEIAAIVLFSPVILLTVAVVSMAVMADFRGRPFYTQLRAGKGGKPFTIYKFRTMEDSSEKHHDYFRHCNERVTRLGAFLRKHRIDELPQLLNILKGDMSLVGPRPEVFQLYLHFLKTIDRYALRKCVPQGITGWAQINLPHTVSMEGNTEKLVYDLYYLKNISFRLDCRIIFKTMKLVFMGRNSQ